MPKAQVNDIQLNYEIHGEGEPLVLIAGIGVGLWVWFKQVPAFSQKFQTIVFDNRGAGQSDKPAYPYSARMMADDVAGLLKSLRIERAHIVGVSLGGFIAQEFALAYPQMTRSLILGCTSFGGPNHVAPSQETLMALASLEGLNTEERARRNLHLGFSPHYITTHADEVERIIQMYLANPIPPFAYLNQLQAAINFNTESRVSEITVPTLVITGDQDQLVPAENSRNLAVKIPNANLVMIEGAGHSVFIERAEEFNQAVIEFLTTVREGA
jgi:pimeloyl-ACP methyl ester carboxylesterase